MEGRGRGASRDLAVAALDLVDARVVLQRDDRKLRTLMTWMAMTGGARGAAIRSSMVPLTAICPAR